MKIQKCVILTITLVVGILLRAAGNDAEKISADPSASTPRPRTYYIAAENTSWNYAATGKDQMTGKPVPAPWGKTIGL